MDFLSDNLPDLSFLSDNEKEKIIEVLTRDDNLRKIQTQKYIKLKQEIDLIESKSLDIPSEHIDTANVCVRCRQSFGYFFNTGEKCPQCGYKVCQKCKINQVENGFLFKKNSEESLWFCILCHKYNQYLVQTGDWIYNGNNDSSMHTSHNHTLNTHNNLTINNINNHAKSNINNNNNSNSFKGIFKKNVSKQRSLSSGASIKSGLSGSQIIKLSLFPSKKDEILDELEQVNFKRSTLTKRYSAIKKAKSQSLTSDKSASNQEIVINRLKDSTSTSTTPISSKSSSINTNLATLTNNKNVNNSLSNSSLANHRQILLINEEDKEKEKSLNLNLTASKAISSIFKFGTLNSIGDEASNNPRKKGAPNAVGDDFDSVTSSEFDSLSTRSEVNGSSNFYKGSDATKSTLKSNSNDSFENSDYLNKTFGFTSNLSQNPINDSETSNNLNQFNKNTINEKLSNNSLTQIQFQTQISNQKNENQKNANSVSFGKMFKREKSPSSNSIKSKISLKSLTTKKGNQEQDNEMTHMDQIFANVRESLKYPKKSPIKESENTSNNKSNISKRQSVKEKPQSLPNSPAAYPNANSNPEAVIDPVDEYLKLQLQKEKFDLKPINRGANNHMSLMRRTKNPFSLERAVSIRSVDEHFTYDTNIAIKGRISVKLAYEKKSSNLSVTIFSCENLSSVNSKKDTCNPYVKVYLVSINKEKEKDKDKNSKRKTPVVKNNCNPIFDDTLRYTLSCNDIDTHQLWISVWHKDTFGRNKFLGEINIQLNADLILNENPSKVWYNLENKV